jgi:hypothetical protein
MGEYHVKNYHIMKDPAQNKTRLFKGAGYLIGFLIGTVVAVSFVAITGMEALIGAMAAAVALPSGAVLEQKIQGKAPGNKRSGRNLSLVFMAIGTALILVVLALLV